MQDVPAEGNPRIDQRSEDKNESYALFGKLR